MKRTRSLLLWFALLMTPAWASSAPGRVDEILLRHQQHGLVSPALAYEELASAVDRPGPSSPIAARSRYWFALGLYAAGDRRAEAAQAAAAELVRLGSTGQCAECQARAMLVEGTLAYRKRSPAHARKVLERFPRPP